jgi:hypothetical protein
MIGYLFFSRWSLGFAKKVATESQKRKYPESFVMIYVEGNGKDFDYGVTPSVLSASFSAHKTR